MDTVFHTDCGTIVYVGRFRIIVGAVIDDIQGLRIRGGEGVAGHVAAPVSSVVIHDEQEIAGAVIVERDIQIYDGPFVGDHLDVAAEHPVGDGDGHPVFVGAEACLVGVEEVHVVIAGFRVAAVVEGDAGDGAGPADFRCRVNLLRQSVVVVRVARQEGASGGAEADGDQILLRRAVYSVEDWRGQYVAAAEENVPFHIVNCVAGLAGIVAVYPLEANLATVAHG